MLVADGYGTLVEWAVGVKTKIQLWTTLGLHEGYKWEIMLKLITQFR
jgi:hypothetical protein